MKINLKSILTILGIAGLLTGAGVNAYQSSPNDVPAKPQKIKSRGLFQNNIRLMYGIPYEDEKTEENPADFEKNINEKTPQMLKYAVPDLPPNNAVMKYAIPSAPNETDVIKNDKPEKNFWIFGKKKQKIKKYNGMPVAKYAVPEINTPDETD